MDEEMIQAYARLTAHQYALEQMMSAWLAGMPDDEADHWIKAFRDRARTMWVRDNIAVSDIPATMIVRDAAELIEGFADQVSRRLAEARAK